jgi:hypothetical protein
MSARIGGMVNNIIMGIITAVIFLLVGVALGPTVIDAANDINATSVAGVPLASVIVLLADYIGAFYYLGIVLGAMAMVWASVRYGKSR